VAGVIEMVSIQNIEGIGPAMATKLMSAGIVTVESLLKKGSTTVGRRKMAQMTGISESNLLKFVNMADLFRISGIGEEYSELLEASGVDTVPELAQRNPENLAASMMAVNEAKKLVRRAPTAEEVESWVAQAQSLPRMIQY